MLRSGVFILVLNSNSRVGVGWPSGRWIWHGGRWEQAREEAHETHANTCRVEQSLQPGLCILGILCLRKHLCSKQGCTLPTFCDLSYPCVALIIVFVCIGTNGLFLTLVTDPDIIFYFFYISYGFASLKEYKTMTIQIHMDLDVLACW